MLMDINASNVKGEFVRSQDKGRRRIMKYKIEVTLKRDNKMVDMKTMSSSSIPIIKLIWGAVCEALSKTPAEGLFGEK